MRSVDALRLTGNAVAELAAELGLMITVAVWGTFGPTIVQVQEAVDQIHVNLRVGAVYAVRLTATGRVFAAFLPTSVIETHLAAEQRDGTEDQRVGDPKAAASFAKEVEQTRRLGFATANGSPIPGINAVSAPVFDHTGQMQLAITLIGPARLVDLRRGSPQVRRLTEFTAGLSAELGYASPRSNMDETVVPLVRPTKAKAPRVIHNRRA
jgi:DNA-binding IclR family transcriptional regulator